MAYIVRRVLFVGYRELSHFGRVLFCRNQSGDLADFYIRQFIALYALFCVLIASSGICANMLYFSLFLLRNS